jgi:hypothetical protein
VTGVALLLVALGVTIFLLTRKRKRLART